MCTGCAYEKSCWYVLGGHLGKEAGDLVKEGTAEDRGAG